MVASEIREKVYDFIENHNNCTKNQAVRGVPDYSRLTILQAIDELMDMEKTGGRVKFTRDKPKGPYKLSINDKNYFNLLVAKFAWLKKHLNESADDPDLKKFLRRKTGKTKSGERLKTTVELNQYLSYILITNYAAAIEVCINLTEDREFLYRKLVSVLIAFGELNKIMSPELISRSKDLLEASKKEKLFQEHPEVYDRFQVILSTISGKSDLP